MYHEIVKPFLYDRDFNNPLLTDLFDITDQKQCNKEFSLSIICKNFTRHHSPFPSAWKNS